MIKEKESFSSPIHFGLCLSVLTVQSFLTCSESTPPLHGAITLKVYEITDILPPSSFRK